MKFSSIKKIILTSILLLIGGSANAQFKLNPVTGKLDLVGSSSSGSTVYNATATVGLSFGYTASTGLVTGLFTVGDGSAQVLSYDPTGAGLVLKQPAGFNTIELDNATGPWFQLSGIGGSSNFFNIRMSSNGMTSFLPTVRWTIFGDLRGHGFYNHLGTNVFNIFSSSIEAKGSIFGAFGISVATVQVTGLTTQPCIGTDGSGNLIAGTCGGGGASSLEVFSNFDLTRTSPTASIGVGDALKLTVSGSTSILNVDFSSITAVSNIFNTANKLVLLDANSFVLNSLLDPSSVTKSGSIFAGSNITLTPVTGGTSISASGGTVTAFAISSYTTGGSTFTYTTPVTANSLTIFACSAGGGGGGGNGQTAGNARGGGSGAGGGGCIEVTISTTQAGTSLTIAIGASGVGGLGGTNGNGLNGAQGGRTSVWTTDGSTVAMVYGGGGGWGNQNTDGSGGAGGGTCGAGGVGSTGNTTGGCPQGTANANGIGSGGAGSAINATGRPAEWGGASGGDGEATTTATGGGASSHGGGGGGGGGVITNLNATGNAAAGGASGDLTSTAANGGAPGTSGAVATDGARGADGSPGHGGGGAGGGGADTDSTGGKGGHGGTCGGAGGGGAAGTNTGGAGGDGGTGCVFIIPHY